MTFPGRRIRGTPISAFQTNSIAPMSCLPSPLKRRSKLSSCAAIVSSVRLRSLSQVMSGGWVGGQIVKFRLRSANVEILARPPGFERTPAKSTLRQVGAGIGGLVATSAGLGDAQQRLSEHLRGNWNAGNFQQRRCDVHEPYLGRDMGCGQFRGDSALPAALEATGRELFRHKGRSHGCPLHERRGSGRGRQRR